ncbi:MAG TPA: menaquinone biosynthesis protein [Terriglobales bacterium]|jgi:chorismate dehydratase|nr:menaquinone biosynthesis protein [Terriglobales bacterium]
MSRLKISAISYLNTAPLMWDFENKEANAGQIADYDVSYTIPSACAEALREGSADIGIVPAAAYASVPNLVIIPDVAIAARRAVRSILLVRKMPSTEPDGHSSRNPPPKEEWLQRIRTVALDTSSMTSVALAKILFAKWLGGERAYKPMAPDLDAMLEACDAAVLIGDPALQIDRTRHLTLDLAEEWVERTGKSFVFAFWAIRRQALEGRDARAIAHVFKQSRDHGLSPKSLEAIAQEWAPRLGLNIEVIRVYLTQNIHYYLDPPCLEGLHLYYQLAAEIGALPPAPELRFL